MRKASTELVTLFTPVFMAAFGPAAGLGLGSAAGPVVFVSGAGSVVSDMGSTGPIVNTCAHKMKPVS